MESTDEQLPEVSKVELVRDLIVGRDRKELDAQLAGMKELFTSMLVENKKEYDKQVNDMRELFVNILEENRLMFKIQLEELQEKIPMMVGNATSRQPHEDLIILANEEERRNEQLKMSKIDAVKEIILGGEIEQLNAQLQEVDKQIERDYQAQREEITALGEELTHALKLSTEKLSEVIHQLSKEISKALIQNEEHKAGRALLSAFTAEMSKKVKD